MDGLLLDTEDIYTRCVNIILEKYGQPSLSWSIKAKLQGRPGPAATALFHDWVQLPISKEEFAAQNAALQRKYFPTTKPLPGVAELLANLGRTRYWDLKKRGGQSSGASGNESSHKGSGNAHPAHPPHRVHIALATSSHSANFAVKTAHLADLFSVFASHRRVLGDDARIPSGRGKPLPDIYRLALKTINDSLPPGDNPISPEECLVFEDSVPGVESGRRAGMRVVWCPHPMLKKEYEGREKDVLAGRTLEAGEVDLHQVGDHDDGWAEYFETLVDFPCERYGIVVPPPEVEDDECMRRDDDVGLVRTNVVDDGAANGEAVHLVHCNTWLAATP